MGPPTHPPAPWCPSIQKLDLKGPFIAATHHTQLSQSWVNACSAGHLTAMQQGRQSAPVTDSPALPGQHHLLQLRMGRYILHTHTHFSTTNSTFPRCLCAGALSYRPLNVLPRSSPISVLSRLAAACCLTRPELQCELKGTEWGLHRHRNGSEVGKHTVHPLQHCRGCYKILKSISRHHWSAQHKPWWK